MKRLPFATSDPKLPKRLQPSAGPFSALKNWNGTECSHSELAKIAEVVTIGKDRGIQEGFRTENLPSKSAQTAWISPRH